jgi:hypothetical protein
MSNEWIWIIYNNWLEGIITKNFLVIQEEQPGLDLLLGKVTRQAEQVRDFPSYLHLYNLKFFWWVQLQ